MDLKAPVTSELLKMTSMRFLFAKAYFYQVKVNTICLSHFLGMNIFRKILNHSKKALGLPNDYYPYRNGKKDFVYIHINKTGGTSISKAVGMPRKQHYTAKETIEIIGQEKWDRAYKFSVVRNPWDKVWSHYNYRVRINETGLRDAGLSFNEWVAITYGEPKNKRFYDQPKMFAPQIDWLVDSNGKNTIDFVGRFEKLDEDFASIAEVIGVEKKLPHLNKSTSVQYHEHYSKESKEIVAAWFARDIETFGYSFDS